MEPETSTPQLGPEQAPIEYGQSIERAPQPLMPESGIERGAERKEQAAEAAAAIADSGFSPILPPPVNVQPVIIDEPSATIAPIAANDDDLIEKEWVDRAKKIIAETKDDPYKREEAVNQLQKDYQRKRYGRELGQA
jgi:hypothetical protein